MTDTLNYLAKAPANADAFPAGHVLVHNHVRPPKLSTRSSVRGFRFWTAPQADHLVLCDCGWNASGPVHYRNKRWEGR